MARTLDAADLQEFSPAASTEDRELALLALETEGLIWHEYGPQGLGYRTGMNEDAARRAYGQRSGPHVCLMYDSADDWARVEGYALRANRVVWQAVRTGQGSVSCRCRQGTGRVRRQGRGLAPAPRLHPLCLPATSPPTVIPASTPTSVSLLLHLNIAMSDCTLTDVTPATPILSTAGARRDTVLESALHVFAAGGYLGTPITAIADHARISPAYVFKLFPSKEVLFVATLERCFQRIRAALQRGADASPDPTPDGVLRGMGGAYAQLISNRSLLMLQVHAQSASDQPEVAAALRRGLQDITTFVKTRSGASDEAVQLFFAYGQLCHLIVTAGLEDHTEAWAQLLTRGIQHPSF